MKLPVGIDSAIASARLWALMLRIRDPAKLHKFWGIRVMNQARANARAKGGRRLWKQIADAIVLNSVSLRGADIRGVGKIGRIGMHKEKGGPIRIREMNCSPAATASPRRNSSGSSGSTSRASRRCAGTGCSHDHRIHLGDNRLESHRNGAECAEEHLVLLPLGGGQHRAAGLRSVVEALQPGGVGRRSSGVRRLGSHCMETKKPLGVRG